MITSLKQSSNFGKFGSYHVLVLSHENSPLVFQLKLDIVKRGNYYRLQLAQLFKDVNVFVCCGYFVL